MTNTGTNFNNWNSILEPIFNSPEMMGLKNWLINERSVKKIYPEPADMFRAFNVCPYEQVRVVVIGIEPYASPGTADGLCFSTRQKETPKELEIIFREIYNDLNIQQNHNISYSQFFPTNSLENWAKQGFLLMNSRWTVEENAHGSHQGKWDYFTKEIIKALNNHPRKLAFLLWGSEPRSYRSLIDSKHVVFEAPYPTYELANKDAKETFTNCRHFSIIRDVLPILAHEKNKDYMDLTDYFDKEKAKEIIKSTYPMQADELNKFVDNELNVYVWVNRQLYYDSLRKFEYSLTTNPDYDK